MIRVHERCRISDNAWFKSVMMFDKVIDNTDSMMDPFLCAAACSYICSKNFDQKYLYATTFLKGCEMTKDGFRVIIISYDELI